MIHTSYVITLFIGVIIAKSSGQSLPCVSNGQPCADQLCPNIRVDLTCIIPVNVVLDGITRWMTSSPSCTLDLDQSGVAGCSGQPSTSPACPPFTAVNAVTGPTLPCSNSTLSFVMSPNLNGTLITCAKATVAGTIGSITLKSVAPPGQPSVSVTPGLFDLTVMWTPNGGSPAQYTIILMGTGSSSTNLTSTRFAGLPSNTAFSIAVVAINCAGNATTYVNTGTLPLPPTSIVVNQVPQGTTTQLTITWTHVGGSVTQYNVMSSSQGYNVTSSPLVKDSCLRSSCTFNQNVKTTGALYNVTMASINAFGVGPWSDPKQGVITQQTSAVAVGVGVGIGLGVPIIMIFVAITAVLAYWLDRRYQRSIAISGPPVAENQLASLELKLYAVEWRDRQPGYESYCSPIYIMCQLNGCVLELKDPHEDDHHVVANHRRLPPHDCQQWYLIDQPNDDTFMIVSKLNGRVLSSQNDQTRSKESLLWRKDGGHIRSVSRKGYVLGIIGGHREPGYPVVLCGTMKDDDMSQMFDEKPAIIPFYYIECQKTCYKAKLPISHDSKNCTECYRCIEINETGISAGVHYTPQSTDAQQWYIEYLHEYLHGQSEESFLIVSKLNGKALYCKGGEKDVQVRATERNDDDDRQHWNRKGSHIISKKFNKIFHKQPKTHQLYLIQMDEGFLSTRSSDAHVRTMFSIKNCSANELCHIQDSKSDLVLDLIHELNGSVCTSNGAAAVFNPKADPSTAKADPSNDSQQWYLHPLSNGHYLIISKLHGKVLTYQIDEEGHRKCFVSNSNGGQDQQWMKKEDSIVSVRYDFRVGKCVDIIADL